jgi:hypothetical protein
MKRTSLVIKTKLAAHITPGGLADETYDFIDELNREAERTEDPLRYVGTANQIEVRFPDAGAFVSTAKSRTLAGWFLRRAMANGYIEGLETVLKRQNSDHRKYLRRHAKTKAGMQQTEDIQKAIDTRLAMRHRIEDFERSIDAIVPGKWPRLWRAGVFMPVIEPHNRSRAKDGAE